MNELNSKRIRNIYIMLIAILCLTIISSTAILSYIFVHWNDKTEAQTTNTAEYDVSQFTEISYNEFLEKYNSSEQSLIYIGRSTCIHCANFIPVLKEAQTNYNYTTYYLDISKITEEQNTKIRNLNNFLNDNFGGTPMVIITKNGKLIGNEKQDGWIGESSYDDFAKFLESVGYEKKD